MRKCLFMFDLDGTLVDAYTAVRQSLNHTRRHFGYGPLSLAQIKRRVGRGDIRFVQQFFRDEHKEAALAMYRRHHAPALRRFARLKPYARETLQWLQLRGIQLAIASNRPARYTDIILRTTAIKRLFACVLCADEINSLKPHPKILREIMRRLHTRPGDTVFVGDMDIDMETAQRAGVDAIFITGGSSRREEIRNYRPQAIIRTLRQLKTYVQNGERTV